MARRCVFVCRSIIVDWSGGSCLVYFYNVYYVFGSCSWCWLGGLVVRCGMVGEPFLLLLDQLKPKSFLSPIMLFRFLLSTYTLYLGCS